MAGAGDGVALQENGPVEGREFLRAGGVRGWRGAVIQCKAREREHLRAVLAIDVLACVHCGGRLRLIATLHDPAVIRKILAHLGRVHSGRSRPRPTPAQRRRAFIASGRGARAALLPPSRSGAPITEA